MNCKSCKNRITCITSSKNLVCWDKKNKTIAIDRGFNFKKNDYVSYIPMNIYIEFLDFVFGVLGRKIGA